MRKRPIDPQLVPRRHLAPERRGTAVIYEPNDALAVDGGRHGLAETYVAKPGLLLRDLRQILRGQIVQVEEQEVVFEPGPQVVQMVALGRAEHKQGRVTAVTR